MRCAVIDIGTNTIRTVIYNVGDSIEKEKDIVSESEILKYTVGKKLSYDGILSLIQVLQKSKAFIKSENINMLYCFATSAMRDVENFDEVNSAVIECCGISIELLSEKEEAFYDFYSIKSVVGDNCNGIGIDLGGGSCQIIVFENGEMDFFASYKLGVKRLYNKFGVYTMDDKKILDYIDNTLVDLPKKVCDTVYVMGGTGKEISRLITNCINIDKLEKLKNEVIENKIICKNKIAERNIPYGTAVIKTVMGHFEAKKAVVLKNGVREGYIKYKVTKG